MECKSLLIISILFIYLFIFCSCDRIPIDKMHSVPTTLLFSLEGMPNMDWEKLLKLQFQDGSFLCSLSSTAYAFMQTKDNNCLKYLTQVVQRFNSGGIYIVMIKRFYFINS